MARRGSIRQRGRDSWELRVYQGLDPGSGRQRWLTKTVHGGRRHAERQLADLVAEAGYARLRAGSVSDLLERWFAAASPTWAAPTARQTRSVIDCHLAPHLGHLPVAKLTTADIDDLYAHLLRAGGRDGRPLAPGTVHRIHVVLHRALAQALRWEWIWLNPASAASPPRVPPAEMRPPTPEEVAALLEEVRHDHPAFFTYLRLAASTGARRSQLLALRWPTSMSRELPSPSPGRRPQWPGSPPHQDPSQLPSGPGRHKRRGPASSPPISGGQRHTAGTAVVGESFVFSHDPDGRRPWTPNWVTKRFIAVRLRAGLPHFRLHDLRHFMATQMLAAGVPIATVSQRLSHARASTTLNVYAHAVPGGDGQAAEVLSAILGSAHSDRDGEPPYPGQNRAL